MKLLFISIFILSVVFVNAQENEFKDYNFQLNARINHYDYDRFNAVVNQKVFSLNSQHKVQEVTSQESRWEVAYDEKPVEDASNVHDVIVTFKCLEGEASQASVSVDLIFDNWSADNYVLMPAAVYNGNRFDYRRIRYSPKLLDPRDIGPDVPTIVSDVPKLTKGKGPSRIQQRTGDMSTPSIGFWSPESKKGFWLLTNVATELGDSGIDIEENRSRTKSIISITAPVVRERYKYRITDSRWPSNDKPYNFKAGDEVSIKFRVHTFDAPELQSLYNYFSKIRKSYLPNGKHNLVLPLSAAFEVQEQKFNELNWESDFGYYSVGPRNMFLQDWQIGWTGGMISTFPLLWMGDEQTKKNVIKNFDWLFPDGIAPSGLFWDSGEHGDKWYGGDIRKPHTKNWHLIRKSGDGLYYVLKQLMLMKKQGISIKPEWEQGTQGAADALAKIWQENEQFGQFVDNPSGKIEVGGSTSGAVIPAALALAAQYFNQPKYLEAAKEAGGYFYENYVKKGLANGGPGDAMQNPDSESSYALVESFATLYEATGDKKWLKMGGEMARQFATWVISYDYKFPENSLFGKEGMHSLGGVFANTQNKHGAPGICTHSGVGLLKLYRATGDRFYIELLQDIARNMPQYLPHPQNPIEGAKTAWMCERVNTTDWLEGIGEISYLTTWSETALMLTYVEIPGLYIEPSQSRFTVFDNIEANIKKDTKSTFTLTLYNPTKMVASVKTLVENAEASQKPLGELALWNCKEIILQPGEFKDFDFKKK
ncbi:MAG: hypothetical protein AAGI07_13625 [Bacteroidota bacterium]